MKEIHKIQVIRKVNKALRTQNGSGITYIYNIFLNDLILMYKEKKGWRKPYKFLSIKGETIQALMDNNLICTFKFTFVHLFKINNFGVE